MFDSVWEKIGVIMIVIGFVTFVLGALIALCAFILGEII